VTVTARGLGVYAEDKTLKESEECPGLLLHCATSQSVLDEASLDVYASE
jgi:hypothetical protein